jgi:hypothetical protein
MTILRPYLRLSAIIAQKDKLAKSRRARASRRVRRPHRIARRADIIRLSMPAQGGTGGHEDDVADASG